MTLLLEALTGRGILSSPAGRSDGVSHRVAHGGGTLQRRRAGLRRYPAGDRAPGGAGAVA
ncbi:hypothetical protein LNO89_21955 [Klebsiella pneumoniae subsp. pneumoniae]|nr:hypothetical protein [Klebsiella pneumoniae subsp. pneumoniae]